jgi:hypothetical protein
MYSLKAGAKLKSRPSGQARRVLAELQRVREPRLATDIDEAIAKSTGKAGGLNGPHITRQDSLRVTLYYLLVFKKAGAVVATEQAVDVDADIAVDEVPEPAEPVAPVEDVPADETVAE